MELSYRYYQTRPATIDDITDITQIHIECFSDGFLTVLGPSAVSAYYKFFARNPLGLFFVVETAGEIVGFASGWERGASYQRPLLQDCGLRLGLSMCSAFLKRPGQMWILLRPRLKFLLQIGRIFATIVVNSIASWIVPPRSVQYDNTKPPPENILDLQINASLLSIVVQHSHRGTEAAHLLNNAFVEECKRRNIREVWLTVKSDNLRARAFYEKHGWNNHKTEGEALHYILALL